MTRKQLYFRLGTFILLASGALIALIIVLGAGNLFRKEIALESYFDESVQGLEVGSKVLLRGVVVGSIRRLTFTYMRYQVDRPPIERKPYVLVEFVIRPELIGAGGLNPDELIRVIRGEVEKGLRVRQVPQGVTGLAYLELDYADPVANPPLAFDWTPEHLYVPSARSTVNKIVSGAEDLVRRLTSVDIEGFVTNVNALAVTLEKKANELQVGHISKEASSLISDLRQVTQRLEKILANKAWDEAPRDIAGASRDAAVAAARIRQFAESEELRKSLAQLQQTLAHIDRAVAGRENDVAATLNNLRQITDNLREVSESAKRYPSGVIFGEPPKPDKRRP
jgi:ABC-type transporter Mla subunit MlaD